MVSGFSIVRNAVSYGYPIVEAISSVLPLCDEFIVNVGISDDGTLDLVKSIKSPKIKIFEREWDMNLRKGGQLISVESNHALSQCVGDWCIYMQADEVLHEKYFPVVRAAMERFLGDERAEALQFRYKHFYGSYDYYQDNYRKWYIKECRVVKRHPNIVSWGDGMDFRHRDGSKLSFKRIDAEIYHYGWVRPPRTMVTKQEAFRRLYVTDAEIARGLPENLYTDLGNLKRFAGPHPMVMEGRVRTENWAFDARLDLQLPDWVRRIKLFFHPVNKRLQRLRERMRKTQHSDKQ